MTIIPIRPEEVDELRVLSILTFHQSFSQFNKKENLHDYYAKAFNKVQLLEELNNTSSKFYWAKKDGQNVGYLKINWGKAQTEDAGTNAMEVQRIYLIEEMRGRGYGAKLLKHAEELALAGNYNTLWLGVWEINTSSIEFYKKCGFGVYDQHDFPFGDEIQTDLLMKKSLTI
jgi:ribosomal protein S18 acetylase RimI-like enzyme